MEILINSTATTGMPPKPATGLSPLTGTSNAQPFNLNRSLIAEGWTNGPAAQRNVTEWAIHNTVSEILRTFVPVTEAGKVVGQRPVSAGELLDLLHGTIPVLPGKRLDSGSNVLVVERPANRRVQADAGEVKVSSVKPARARAAQLLSVHHLHDKKNLDRFLKWALEHGYAAVLKLPHDQRKLILSGQGVHPDAVVAVKTAPK